MSMEQSANAELADDEMRAEYDFTGAVRGKYFGQMIEGTNVVRLDPDVWAAFPDSDSVNRALRLLIEIAQREPGEKVLAEKRSSYSTE